MISNDYFLVNKTKPYLIEKNIIDKVIKTNIDENNKVFNYFKDLTYDFVKKNIVSVTITLVIIFFLLYRYCNYYNHSKILNKKVKHYVASRPQDTNHLQGYQLNYQSQEPIKRKLIDISNTNDILDYYS